MGARRRSEEAQVSRRKPATTPDDRENEMIALAYDATEKRIRGGEASSQELTHFLKLGSSRERLEQARLENENLLTTAKIEEIKSRGRIEELMGEAIKAFGIYRGEPVPEELDGLDQDL